MFRASDSPRSRRSGESSVPLLAKLAALGAVLLAIWWLAVSSPEDPSDAEDFAAAGAPASPGQSEPAQASAARGEPQQAEQAEPPSDPAAPAADPAAPVPDRAKPTVNAVLPQRQGPVDELSNTFASESRGEGSAPEEARVKEAFVDPQIAKALLHSVECRRSVCRLELRWSPERDPGYVLGLTKAVGNFSSPLGVEDPGPADAQGQRPLVVYFGVSH